MKPALHIPRIGKTLLAAALVAMAGTAAAGKAIEGDIDAAKALTFLYGNLQTTKAGGEKPFGMPVGKEWALWKNPQCDDLSNTDCPKEAKVHSAFGTKYTEQDKEKYFLLTRTADENPIFGAAIFAKEGGQWVLEMENRYIGNSPDMLPPREKYLSPDAEDAHGMGFLCFLRFATESSLVRIGPDRHGVLISAHGLAGSGNTDCLVMVMPYQEGVRSFVLDTVDYWDSEQVGSGKWSASFDEKSAGEYYDVVVRYQAQPRRSKAKRAEVRKFHFRDGNYYEVAAPKAGKKGAKKRK